VKYVLFYFQWKTEPTSSNQRKSSANNEIWWPWLVPKFILGKVFHYLKASQIDLELP